MAIDNSSVGWTDQTVGWTDQTAQEECPEGYTSTGTSPPSTCGAAAAPTSAEVPSGREDGPSTIEDWARGAFRSRARRLPGLRDDGLDDAVQEFSRVAIATGKWEAIQALRRRRYASRKYDEAEKLANRIVNRVVDRLRRRHRLKVKPGSPWQDSAGATQRSLPPDVPLDVPLGETALARKADSPRGWSAHHVEYDVARILETLDEVDRDIFLHRVHDEKASWKAIGQPHGLTARQTATRCEQTRLKLQFLLRDYEYTD